MEFLVLPMGIAIIAFIVWIQKVLVERKKADTTETAQGILVIVYSA